MPDVIDKNGLQVKNFNTLRIELETALKAIYGNDINVSQSSPDGQQINIYVQGSVDTRELLQQINASFDPDQAEGRVLDQRVSIIGIKRNEGTFTFQSIDITIDRALNLIGLNGDATELDPDIENLYTAKDDEGTEFYLLSSQSEAGAGTYSYIFRAAQLGKVETIPNTITTPVTVIPGVTGINNPSAASSVGKDEETDIELKLRRKVSTAIAAIGYLDALEAALKNLNSVTSAFVYENDTPIDPDSRGIPAHTMWIIIEGGDNEDIAQIVYAKKSSGSGMKGTIIIDIIRPNGDIYQVKFDRPVDEDLYMRFTITPTLSEAEEIDLKNEIASNLFWEIGGDATSDIITCFVKNYLGTNFVVSAVEVSLNGSDWFELVSVSSLNNRFQNDTTRITIS